MDPEALAGRRGRLHLGGSIRTRLLSASDSRPPIRSIAEVAFSVGDGLRRLERSSRRRTPPSRRKSRRSPSFSRSWLQAIAPRSVRCRSGRSRAPPPRSRLRPSRSRIAAGLRGGRGPRRARSPAAGRRAARRSPGSSPRVSSVEHEVGPVGQGAILEERDAGVDAERRHRVAALAADPQQLAARDEESQRRARHGRGRRRCPRRPEAAARGCRATSSRIAIAEVQRGGPRRPAASAIRGRRSCSAIADSSSAGSRSAARSTNHVPCGNRSATRPRRRRARGGSCRCHRAREGHDPARPPAPRARRSISASRPTSVVTVPGRLEGGSIVRSGRSSSAAPGTTRRWSRAGSSKSLTARSPSSTSATPCSPRRSRRERLGERAGQDDLAAVRRRRRSARRSSRRSRRSPRARRRAVAREAGPRRGGGPSGRRTAARVGHGVGGERALAATTARGIRDGVANAAKNASPSVLTTTPPAPSIASRSSRSWLATTAAQAADPTRRSSRVEPSMSVNRNVTAGPVGSPIRGAHHRRRACTRGREREWWAILGSNQ